MKTCPPLRFLLSLVCLALLSLAALPADASGFSNTLLTQGERGALAAPCVSFRQEIDRLYRERNRKYESVAPPNDGDLSRDLELADLHLALSARGLPEHQIATICARHAKQRAMLDAPDREPEPLAELPVEFADYFRGAIFWHRAELETDDQARGEFQRKARDAWTQLLQHPASERPYKSTWAAYMVGLAERARDDSVKAIASFEKVRSLVDAGFADPLGLAVASLGQEAQIAWSEQTNLARAIELYLQQGACGDPTGIDSLRIVAEQGLKPENARALERLAADPDGRRVITAYVVSLPGMRSAETGEESAGDRWLKLLEAQNIREADLVEQIALAAYQNRQMELAKRWLERANPRSFNVRWINAKLLLYHGEIAGAVEVLEELAKEFPVMEGKPVEATDPVVTGDLIANDFADTRARLHVLGEIGMLRLARREYTEALDALLRAGFWIDAAYVAERVLTVPELMAYVDAQWSLPQEQPDIAAPREESEANPEGWGQITDPKLLRDRIRFLLARRLARTREEAKARAYFTEEWREHLDAFIALSETGRDPEEPPRERARNLFAAAKLMREHGLEVWGTETAPDWFAYGGEFTESVTVEARAALPAADHLHPLEDELTRARVHRPQPDRRFHYRYTAAELALEAAKLVPDNDNETALILCTAGSWLKNCDPKAADPFYKTLVRRCRKTAIGKEADKIRWFPRIDENGNILPKPAPAPQPAPVAPPPEILDQFPLAMR